MPTASSWSPGSTPEEHLADRGSLRGIDAPPEELERFKDLVDGAFHPG